MNKVFITGKILNKIELVYHSNIPYIKNLEIECEGQTYFIQCCQENALIISKNADKGDIIQIEGHLSKDKNNKTILIIIADKVDIFRNEKTNSQIISELKDEDNINNCLNQNTKMILSKMNAQHFIAMLNEVSKISSMFNSIIYDEANQDDENDIEEKHSNSKNVESDDNHNLRLQSNQNETYRADGEKLT